MAKVLNFGSLNIDFVYQVPYFLRPGETLSSFSMAMGGGGKGLNQSIAAAGSGCDTYHAGCVGKADGKFLLEILEAGGVDCALVERCDIPSGNAFIQVDTTGENCILLYGGANRQITMAHIHHVLSQFGAGDYLLLQNEVNHLAEIITEAKARGMTILFNPAPFESSVMELPLELVDYLVVNELEGADLAETQGDGMTILTALREKFPKAKFVLTMGANGAYYFDGEGVYFEPSRLVDVVDTTAAGDTFIGYFVSGLVDGLAAQEILQLATKASAITITREGASSSIPKRNEL